MMSPRLNFNGSLSTDHEFVAKVNKRSNSIMTHAHNLYIWSQPLIVYDPWVWPVSMTHVYDPCVWPVCMTHEYVPWIYPVSMTGYSPTPVPLLPFCLLLFSLFPFSLLPFICSHLSWSHLACSCLPLLIFLLPFTSSHLPAPVYLFLCSNKPLCQNAPKAWIKY